MRTIMQLSDYQRAAARTAGGEHRRERAILGFYGELHEGWETAAGLRVPELGDRAWYLAEICTSHDLNLDELVSTGERHWYGRGALAEARKKHLRGDYDEDEYLRRVGAAVATEWSRLQQECWACRTTLSAVLEHNIAKLADRAERGVIQGDGER